MTNPNDHDLPDADTTPVTKRWHKPEAIILPVEATAGGGADTLEGTTQLKNSS